MREIVLDTETTGFDPVSGDRIVEIGGVELVNGFPTGRTFHVYLNPERDMPPSAEAIHGLSAEFLADKPRFAEIADQFLEFIGDAKLVAHNAGFDFAFLCAELKRIDRAELGRDRVIDTLMLARRKHPGGGNKLDDLCARYGIDNSRRTKHGALLDAELLAEVYAELSGGKQAKLILVEETSIDISITSASAVAPRAKQISRLTNEERLAHLAFVNTLGDNAIWLEYLKESPPDAAE